MKNFNTIGLLKGPRSGQVDTPRLDLLYKQVFDAIPQKRKFQRLIYTEIVVENAIKKDYNSVVLIMLAI